MDMNVYSAGILERVQILHGAKTCATRDHSCAWRERARGKRERKKKLFNRGTPNRERNKRSLYLISERRRVPVGRTGLVEARRKLSYAGD